MNEAIKYTIYFFIGAIGYFIVSSYLEKTEKEKPTLFIDNYSGSDIKIFQKDDLWLEINNNSSIKKRDLKQGTHILYVHKMNDSSIDTFRINMRKENNYVLNLFGGMTYYEGELLYLKKLEDGVNHSTKEEREITKSFFQSRAEFIFEKPPYRIEDRSIVKMPTSKRKYLRRKNQVW